MKLIIADFHPIISHSQNDIFMSFSLNTVDSGCQVHALISLNGKEMCAYMKVCAYKGGNISTDN